MSRKIFVARQGTLFVVSASIIVCPYGVVDPKLGSWERLNQVLHFFWRGVYMYKLTKPSPHPYSKEKVCDFRHGIEIP